MLLLFCFRPEKPLIHHNLIIQGLKLPEFSKLIKPLLTGASIILVFGSVCAGIISVINLVDSNKHRWFYYDNKFIPIMQRISELVPQDQTIVVSYGFSEEIYFIKHKLLPLVVGGGCVLCVVSQKSLVNYMKDSKLSYLLVFENFTDWSLVGLNWVALKKIYDSLFSPHGLKDLNKDFEQVANYTTENHYKFDLYRIKDPR